MSKTKCTYSHVDKMTESRGWFRLQLWTIEGMLNGRWPYWLAICLNRTIGKLPEWSIPQIKFNAHFQGSQPTPALKSQLLQSEKGKAMLAMVGSPADANKHIISVFEKCLRRSGYLQQLIDWWLWGFGSARVKERPKIDEEAAIILYSEFEIHRLIGNPADWGAQIGSTFLERSKKGTGWFPTPAHIANMMAKMTIGDDDCRTKSVMDPCVGTGIFLLEASNYSLNLYGVDIDPLICSLCEFAGWLYVPWMVCGNKSMIKEFKEEETVYVKDVESKELQTIDVSPGEQGVLFPELINSFG